MREGARLGRAPSPIHPLMRRAWTDPAVPPPEVAEELADFDPLQRQLLYGRGLRTREAAHAFLAAAGSQAGHDPWLLQGMNSAVERLIQAIEAQEPIVVYGDYDADGVLATVLLVEALEAHGAKVSAYIPDRFDEGYGLHAQALTTLAEEGARVVVTVDCGTRSVPEADHARRLGLDLIITDHHVPGPTLPRAIAVVNPRRADETYPFRGLSGVGVAYKLAQALKGRLQGGPPAWEGALDLVALGTIADLAPLLGENRGLVRAGLRRLQRADRPGLKALCEAASVRPERTNAATVGFILAPRINAAGRLESARSAFNLLRSRAVDEARELARSLDRLNRERQDLTRQMVGLARQRWEHEGRAEDPVVFVAGPEFHEGVVGLAAGRLAEALYRPVVVAVRGEEVTKGSARSIPGFHITQALEHCQDLLLRYGGHSRAAGFSLRSQHLPGFAASLQAYARQVLRPEDLQPRLCIDAWVRLASLTPSLMAFLQRLEPFGEGNAPPVFGAREVRVVRARPVGRDRSHLKLTLAQGRVLFDAIAFRLGHLWERLPERVDIAFHFEINEYQGVESFQLNVLDLRPARA